MTCPSQRKPTRRRLTPAARREELLTATAQVVAEVGYQGLTVPRVVAVADASQGSFYRYFSDVDDAFVATVSRSLAPIAMAAASLSFDAVHSCDALEQELLRFYRAVGAELETHAVVIREALVVAPHGTGAAAKMMADFVSAMRARAAELLRSARSRAPFRDFDAEIAASAIVSMVIGAASAAADAPHFDAEHWASELARFEAGALTCPRGRHS